MSFGLEIINNRLQDLSTYITIASSIYEVDNSTCGFINGDTNGDIRALSIC